MTGDQSDVLPTDTQRQTAYAYAKEKGLVSIEDYGLELARHFVRDIGPVQGARIEIDEFAWQRAVVDGAEHDHTWIRKGQEVRTAAVTVDGDGEWVVGGLKDLVILKSTGSQFAGFLTDAYTVLEPTHDRVMATSLVAQWRFTRPAEDWQIAWDEVYAGVKTQLANSSRWCGRLRFSRRCTQWPEQPLLKFSYSDCRMRAAGRRVRNRLSSQPAGNVIDVQGPPNFLQRGL